MQSNTNQNYPSKVVQQPKYQAPPRVGDIESLRENQVGTPPKKKNGPKIGLVVGVAAVAGFLGGVLWSKAKKNREGDAAEADDTRPVV